MAERSILVVGGCGFLGYHIVSALLSVATWDAVHAADLDISRNRHPTAKYHKCDLNSRSSASTIITRTNPAIIIHCASPNATFNSGSEKFFFQTNVRGTQTLLELAAKHSSVKGFVYTSSFTVPEGATYNFLDETASLKTLSSRTDPYSKSKAVADKLVLAANCENLRTASLRPASMYGERDTSMILGALVALRQGRQRFQIGDNTSLMDTVSAENIAMAHVLASKALELESHGLGSGKVSGQAFFITDGKPMPFWDYQRKIYRAAGDRTPPERIITIPAWFMLALASTVEWLYWIFTLGSQRPKNMRRYVIEFTCKQKTFSITKARELLGYAPVEDMDKHIQDGVDWLFQQEVEASRKKAT